MSDAPIPDALPDALRRDITDRVLEAARSDIDWSEATVHRALREIARLMPNADISWEPGDENWGTIGATLDGQRERLDLFVHRPLAFYSNALKPRVADGLNALNIASVCYEDFFVREFRIREDLLTRFFGESARNFAEDGGGPDCFSAEDIWFSTITGYSPPSTTTNNT